MRPSDGPALSRLRSLLERSLEAAVAVLVAALALVVIVGVSFRHAGAALPWYDEVASVLLAWLTYYGAALAALRRGHIGVPTLVERMRPALRMWAVAAAEAAVLLFFAVLAWAGWQVQGALAGTAMVSLPSVPAAVARSAVPIGAVLFVVAQLASLPQALGAVRTSAKGAPADPPRAPGRPASRPPAAGKGCP